MVGEGVTYPLRRIPHLELVSTLPGEPFYAAMGYEVTKRFDVAMPDGVTIPAAHMVKSLG